MCAALPPYPACKPSGIEWLGDIPAHWDARRLKDWVSINREALPETTNPDYEFHYLEIGAVGTGSLLDEPVRMRFSDAPSRARRIVRAGDTIISTVRTYLKAVWFADETDDDLICSTGFAVLTPRNGTVQKFVSYLVQSDSFTDRVTADSLGIAYPAISEGRLSSFHVAVPPLAEQSAIVCYLDRADERIRRAISAKQRLIELLTEQRQAVIHRAVTRGLDPDARPKDSGMEWLGDVPEGWRVTPIKRAFASMDYGISVSASDSGVIRLLTMGDLNQGRVTVPTTGGVNSVDESLLLEKGDLLFNRTNSQELVGKVGLFAGYPTPVTFASYLVRLRPNSRNKPEYLNALLNDAVILSHIRKEAIPSLHQSNLNPTRYGRIKVPLPPLNEQASVVEHLDKTTAKIDAAIDSAQRQIDLLREYRTRLIADAVAGRVDVRHEA